MRILLVYPEYPDTFWSFRHALKFSGKKAAFPPLGLLTVAAMFPKEWEARLVDENVEPLRDHVIRRADMVFVSAMLAQDRSTIRILRRCRELGKKTVLGGPMVTADPERFSGLADHLVLGEAECVFPAFLEHVRSGVLEPRYAPCPGVRAGFERRLIPRWELLGRNLRQYASMVAQWGRGCPHDCEFCDVTSLFGRRMRLKRTEDIVAELRALYDYGWRGSVFFVDDNFIGNKPKAKTMLADIIGFQRERAYPFKFYTQVDIGLADDDALVNLMVEAGFFRVFTGIETPEIESLKGANKHQNVNADIAGSVRFLHRSGIQVQSGFVLGFDQDTKETPDRMIGFIQRIGVMTAMVGTLQALPGTKLYERLLSEGRLLGRSSGDNTDGSVGFVPKNMAPERLEAEYRRVVSTLYSPKPYHDRLMRFLAEYRRSGFERQRVSWSGLRAFILSIVRIGVFSRARRWYWRSLREAISGNPTALATVVELWIFWFHFDRVARTSIGGGIKPEP